MCDAVAHGRVDCAIVGGEVPEELRPSLAAEPFAQDELALMVRVLFFSPWVSSRGAQLKDEENMSYLRLLLYVGGSLHGAQLNAGDHIRHTCVFFFCLWVLHCMVHSLKTVSTCHAGLLQRGMHTSGHGALSFPYSGDERKELALISSSPAVSLESAALRLRKTKTLNPKPTSCAVPCGRCRRGTRWRRAARWTWRSCTRWRWCR